MTKLLALLTLTLWLAACGAPLHQLAPVATSAAIPTPSGPIAKPAPARREPIPRLAGPWEFSFIPDAQAGDLPGTPQATLVEINLQQSGNSISATKDQLFVLDQYPGPDYQFSSLCLGDEVGNLGGTISDDGLGFTLSITGDNGVGTGVTTETAITSGTINSDGTLTGTYTGPNTGLDGCPLNSAGSFAGTKVTKQFSGTYMGGLANGEINSQEAISMTFTQAGSALEVTGTDNGDAFDLTGTVLGAFFAVPTYVSGFGRSQSFIGYLPLNDTQIWLQDEVSGDAGTLEPQQ
jgi:hypothetical protein